MSQQIIETRLVPFPIQSGVGYPTHISPSGTMYYDKLYGITYQNIDGVVSWVPFSTGGNTFTGGTVSGPTTFLSDVTMSSLYVGNINDVDYINFNTSPTVPSPTGGTLFFDSVENALSYKPITPSNDVTVNIGQESLIKIYNDLGYQINNGQALHITGATSGAPTVSLAVGTGGDEVQFQISGIATHDIPDSSFGFMTVFGTVRDINLTAFTVGEQIYLSQTVPGGFVSYSGLSFTGRTCEVGHIIDNSALGKLQVSILNEIEGTIITTQENNILAANNSSTGIFEFSGLSITTPSGTTFNVGAVDGWIIDNVTEPANPKIQLIIYPGSTGNTALYVSSATETYILLTSGLTITQQTTFPTPQQRRENLYLGKFGHANRQFLINAFNEPDSSLSPVSQLRDMFTPIRLINEGVYPSANGNNLTFNTSSGVLYGLGLGHITNKLNPNSLSVLGTSPCTFQYRTQTGGTASNTTLIIPGVYDNNGVITAVGGGSNSSTNQRIYLVQNGQFRLQYGQQVYGSLAAAIEASQNEAFTTFSNFRDNAILIGILSVNKNATNLSDTTQARFLLTSKFGETVGAAGGISTTTLQQAYDNSVTPEIVTNSVEGALSIQNGTGAADNVTNLFEGRNTATSITSFITAAGGFSGSSVSATTYHNLPFYLSGTTSYLPKFSSSTAITDSIIYDTGTNIGIGETAPEGKLHIKNASAGSVSALANSTLIVENSTTNYLSMLSPDASPSGIIFGSPSDNFGAFLRWTYSTGVMEFSTANAGDYITFGTGNFVESMRLNATGLGIGTTSIADKLHVSGSTRLSGNLSVYGDTTITGTTSSTNFTGSSDTISGTKGSVTTSGSSTTAFINVSGSNTIGGTGYTDFIRVTNTAAGATNTNKTIRVNNTGSIEFLNSAYSAQIFSIADNGIIAISSPASVTSNSATNNALNIGTKGQLFDDGNFHIHSSSGAVWINALDGSAIRLGTQTNSGNSTVIVDTSTVGHSFFTKVQSAFDVAFGTEITMDNLKVRINGTGGSGGLVQAGAVSGSFNAYTTLFGNVAGFALRGDTNSGGITFTTTYQNISSAQASLSAGGDITTLHLIDTTNSRIYRVTAIHCQSTTGGYTSIERMA